MNYCKLTVLGRVGKVEEIKTIDREKLSKVLNFSVAYNRSKKNQHGEYESEVTWYQCSLWNKQAEYWCNKLNIGDEVLVEGEPSIIQSESKFLSKIKVESIKWIPKRSHLE